MTVTSVVSIHQQMSSRKQPGPPRANGQSELVSCEPSWIILMTLIRLVSSMSKNEQHFTV